MFKRIFILLVYFVFWQGLTKSAWADTPISGTSANLNYKNTVKIDLRGKILKNFLVKYDSPLAQNADEIVFLADQYQLDYRLVVAIAGVESTFCKSIPYNSYNCWGWKNGKHAFASYSDGLEKVSRTLNIHYLGRGFDTPETIGPIYAPPSPDWAWKVRFFMNLLKDDVSSAFLVKQFSI